MIKKNKLNNDNFKNIKNTEIDLKTKFNNNYNFYYINIDLTDFNNLSIKNKIFRYLCLSKFTKWKRKNLAGKYKKYLKIKDYAKKLKLLIVLTWLKK